MAEKDWPLMAKVALTLKKAALRALSGHQRFISLSKVSATLGLVQLQDKRSRLAPLARSILIRSDCYTEILIINKETEMKSKNLLGLSMLCVLTLATTDSRAATDPTDVPYTIVSSGIQNGISNHQQIRVMDNSRDLSSLLSETTLSGAVPNTNFSSDMLVALFASSGSTCEKWAVVGVKETDLTRAIVVRKKVFDGTRLTVMTYPYAFVEFEKTSKPISVITELEPQ